MSDKSLNKTGESQIEPEFKWYIVHTYSGHEEKAKKQLEERIRSLKMQNFFSDILVPQENVVEIVKGEKKTTKKRFFPGYILVRMILTNKTWHVVKDTSKITGFVGSSTQPPSISDEEVKKLTRQIDEGTLRSKVKTDFQVGDQVRVSEGPFANFNGVVEEVKPEKEKLKVLVSIFGRSTPVELDFSQVEKS
ncbi:MAG: transcription termination/antitermination factor NusG [Deltaproteobacteria bacterium]|nr:transcription termination/antitermination factor NusG [Deltaproteobacteria bacterium]